MKKEKKNKNNRRSFDFYRFDIELDAATAAAYEVCALGLMHARIFWDDTFIRS